MNPGPMTARNISRRILHTLSRRIWGMTPEVQGETLKTTQNKRTSRNAPTGRPLQLGAQHADDIIGGDHAGQHTFFVDYRQGEQVVLVEQFGDLFLVSAG